MSLIEYYTGFVFHFISVWAFPVLYIVSFVFLENLFILSVLLNFQVFKSILELIHHGHNALVNFVPIRAG